VSPVTYAANGEQRYCRPPELVQPADASRGNRPPGLGVAARAGGPVGKGPRANV
jgi:hypothetical protein